MSGSQQAVIIIGSGSIAQRHAQLLTARNLNVALVSTSGHQPPGYKVFFTLNEALACLQPQWVIIANPTAAHEFTLQVLIASNFFGKILIEKPIFSKWPERFVNEEIKQRIFVGYQFRFHPLLQLLKNELTETSSLSAQGYVGQYLPSWRRRDYQKCYSACKNSGGGVLRDLSHELDYLQFLFGKWQRVAACGGKLSKLQIDSEDTVAILLEFERCSVVSLELNYTNRIAKRCLHIACEEQSYALDFIKLTLDIGKTSYSQTISRDDVFNNMYDAFFSSTANALCTFEQGLETVRLILAIEQAMLEKRWIQNEEIMYHMR